MNQASNRSLVVPVLPATGLPSAAARPPVPGGLHTSVISCCVKNAVSGVITCSGTSNSFAYPAAMRSSSHVQGS